MTALAPRDYSHVSTGCAILWGNQSAPDRWWNTRRALSHHEGDAIVTTSTYYTNSTPQLNSPIDAKPEFDLPRVLPCYTCKWYDSGEWADDTFASVWAEPFCMRGLYLPTKKLTCKRHEQDGAR